MISPALHLDPPVEVVPAQTLTTWPPGTFVENILPLPDGSIVVSLHAAKRLERVASDNKSTLFADMPMPPAGMLLFEGEIFVAGGEVGTAPGAVWRVSDEGEVEHWVDLSNALFLNGFTPKGDGKALVVDSLLGCIFEVDLRARVATEWFRHELLSKCSDEPMLPGVNGIKRSGDRLVLTNTDRALVLQLTILPSGAAGELSVLCENLRGDDIAFDCDENLYIATHIHNSVVRVSPSGTRTTIATVAEGMAGSTACAFARDGLLVTTTGGVIMPYQGQLQRAKLVQLQLDTDGLPVTFHNGVRT